MTEHRRIRHDIRNCMNAMRLNAECLALTEGQELRECVDAIHDAADRVVSLLDEYDTLPADPGSSQPI